MNLRSIKVAASFANDDDTIVLEMSGATYPCKKTELVYPDPESVPDTVIINTTEGYLYIGTDVINAIRISKAGGAGARTKLAAAHTE